MKRNKMKRFLKKLFCVTIGAIIFVLPFLPIMLTYLPSCESVFFYSDWQLVVMRFTVYFFFFIWAYVVVKITDWIFRKK